MHSRTQGDKPADDCYPQNLKGPGLCDEKKIKISLDARRPPYDGRGGGVETHWGAILHFYLAHLIDRRPKPNP